MDERRVGADRSGQDLSRRHQQLHVRGGGDGYKIFADNAQNAYDFGPGLEQVVADYLGANRPYTPKLDGSHRGARRSRARCRAGSGRSACGRTGRLPAAEPAMPAPPARLGRYRGDPSDDRGRRLQPLPKLRPAATCGNGTPHASSPATRCGTLPRRPMAQARSGRRSPTPILMSSASDLTIGCDAEDPARRADGRAARHGPAAARRSIVNSAVRR